MKLAAMCGLSAGIASASQSKAEREDGSPMMALGYISRILPDDYIHGQKPMKLAEDIVAHVGGISSESERREISLAGVSAAAHGNVGPQQIAEMHAWAWHPAYQDTVDLRRKFDAAMRMLQDRIPAGQQIMLYPCGCSALANLPEGEFLPFRCGCGAPDGANSLVLNPHRAKPTIAELEKILTQDGNGPAVTILPNGQVAA